MTIRIFSFMCGALFGAAGALIHFWIDQVKIHWGVVGLCPLVMGLLALFFGKRFWETAPHLWP